MTPRDRDRFLLAVEWAAAVIEEHSKDWLENGPSKAAARAIVKKLRFEASRFVATSSDLEKPK